MLKNIHKLFVLLALMTSAASGEIYISTPVHFDIDNGAWVTLEPQNVDNLSLFNSTGSPASSVKFWINGTEIIFTAQINKTLSNLSYILDNFTWNGDGAYGWFNITARMQNGLSNYSLRVDSSIIQNDTASGQGWVIFTYPEANAHFYEILQTGIAIIIPPTGTNKTTVLTFTDVSCFNIGTICNSELKVYQDGKVVGSISSQQDYITIPAGNNTTLSLSPSSFQKMNNVGFVKESIIGDWMIIVSILLAIGLLTSMYYIIRRLWYG